MCSGHRTHYSHRQKVTGAIIIAKPAAMVTINHKHKHPNNVVFVFGAFLKVFIDTNNPVASERGTGKRRDKW